MDDEFSRWSVRLFEEFRQGQRIAVISDLTRREIEGAPENVKEILLSLPDTSVENVFLTEEAEELALRYVDDGVVSLRHIVDAQHIAIASVERVDLLVSWNFRQIVNVDRMTCPSFSGYKTKRFKQVFHTRTRLKPFSKQQPSYHHTDFHYP